MTQIDAPRFWRPLLLMFLLAIGAPVRSEEPADALVATVGQPRQHQWPQHHIPHAEPIKNPPYAMIRDPQGVERRHGVFHYRTFERTTDPAGLPLLKAIDETTWMLRWTPEIAGRHEIILYDADDTVLETLHVTAMAAEEQPSLPFIRRQPDETRYLVASDGTPFFAIGHNVCWVDRKSGIDGFRHYFDRMAEANENYTRIWFCTWGLSLDTQAPHVIDLRDAWRLDQVLELAAARGIRVMLCFDNFHDFRENWHKSPFNRQNGGPCRNSSAFFTDSAAREQYKTRLQYIVARYGAYPSVLAWELWNEMEYALSATVDETVLNYTAEELRDDLFIPWTLNMARTLQKLDPYRHPITTSLGNRTVWPSLWAQPEMDLVQHHAYIHYYDFFRLQREYDAAEYALWAQNRIADFGKPALVSEFGYLGPDSRSPMNDRDPDGIALHNSIWSVALSESAGIPALWWWDNYIDPQNLYSHYAALSKFLQGFDRAQSNRPIRVEGGGLRVLALHGSTDSLLWVQNMENTWYQRVEMNRQPLPIRGARLVLTGFPAGNYQIHWFDPYAGLWQKPLTIESINQELRIDLPVFKNDIAAKLRLVKNEK